jgi:hypothetical protein
MSRDGMLLLLQICVLKDGLVIRCQPIEGGRRRSEGKKSVRRPKDLLVLNRGVVLLVLGGEQPEYSLDGSWGRIVRKRRRKVGGGKKRTGTSGERWLRAKSGDCSCERIDMLWLGSGGSSSNTGTGTGGSTERRRELWGRA